MPVDQRVGLVPINFLQQYCSKLHRLQCPRRSLAIELSSFLKENLKQLHADALTAAISEIACLTREASHWQALSQALATHPDERLRRIALAALVAAANQPPGWTDEYRFQLEAYRQDDSVLVAAAANFTFPPELPHSRPDPSTN